MIERLGNLDQGIDKVKDIVLGKRLENWVADRIDRMHGGVKERTDLPLTGGVAHRLGAGKNIGTHDPRKKRRHPDNSFLSWAFGIHRGPPN